MITLTGYARILGIAIFMFASSFSTAGIDGIWHGKLFADTDNELAVHFLIKSTKDGQYNGP